MQYADPFIVKCENCGFEAEYPLDNVLKFSVDCQKCGFRLNECADLMHKNITSHNASLWPTHFIFEGLEYFKLDIDEVTDDEFGSIKTVEDFCDYVEFKLGSCAKSSLFSIPMLSELQSKYELNELLEMRLVDLGNIIYKKGH